MPLTPPLDDEGRPIDPEQYERLCDREYAAREVEFRVERYVSPDNPELVAFRVIDSAGHIRGFIGFEFESMEWDLPERMLARVQRAAAAASRPDIRLVS